jgi:hypothetical protein
MKLIFNPNNFRVPLTIDLHTLHLAKDYILHKARLIKVPRYPNRLYVTLSNRTTIIFFCLVVHNFFVYC